MPALSMSKAPRHLLHLRETSINDATGPAAPDSSTSSSDDNMELIMAVLGLIFISTILVSTLFCLRRARMARGGMNNGLPAYDSDASALPPYHDQSHHHHHLLSHQQQHASNARRLTSHTADGRSSVVVLGGDGHRAPMLSNPQMPPHSPDNVPEIHITFPDEQDETTGGSKTGRVVVVRIGEKGGVVGLEPVRDDEQLPAYERVNSQGFRSVDMDRIGGLREKEFC